MSGSVPPVMTAAQFRGLYPEFSDIAAYPDAIVELWIQTASDQLDPLRWANLLFLGVANFTAHYLAIGRKNYLSASAGGAPGGAGLANLKTVGRATVQLDTENTTVKGAGFWNLTTYGTQFIYFARMVGSGGQQVTGPMVLPNMGVVGVY